jgi:DNA-binding response OmpR family regulator
VEISIKCQQSATLGRSNAGFDIGADDYIAKPFSVREVVARVFAVLRIPAESFIALSLSFKSGAAIPMSKSAPST